MVDKILRDFDINGSGQLNFNGISNDESRIFTLPRRKT